MRRKKTIMFMFLAMFTVLMLGQGNATVQAASYSSDYRYWSQGASDDAGMREWGCWIVAQAKLLYETNIDRSGSFNPDTYYRWQVANGLVSSGFQLDGRNAPVKYAQQKGKKLEFLGWWDASDYQLKWNIDAGYYTILQVKTNTGGDHYVMMANELSKSTGQLYCYDSFTTNASVSPQLISSYPVHVAGFVYKVQSHTHSYSSQVTKQPSCTTAGVKTFTCSCGSSYTEQIAATGHKYAVQTVAPTTTQQGYTLHKCTVCGNSYKDNYKDPPKADGGWYYCDALPTGVTSDKYKIEYNNYYEKTQSTSPGSGWTNAGTVKNEWQNTGAQYKSNTDLATSDSRILVSSIYYHWCGPTMGEWGNYEQSGGYVHYDQIPADWVSAKLHGYDNGHPYYLLYWSNGVMVYCKTGDTCDGSWGTHGTRCASWYKENTYQDRKKVVLYKYTKESGWTGSRDGSATKVTYRYKAKDTGSETGSSSAVPTPPKTTSEANASKTAPQTTPQTAPQTTPQTTPQNAPETSNPKAAPKASAPKVSVTKTAPKAETPQKIESRTYKSQQTTKMETERSTAVSLEEGDGFNDGVLWYSVTKGGINGKAQVEVTGVAVIGADSVTVPAVAEYKGVSCRVTAIGSDAFCRCKNLKKVIIGENVKSIGSKAFYCCGKLKNITIKTTGLTKRTVGNKAFKNISKKAVVRVPGKCLKVYKAILKARGAGKSVKIRK